MSMDTHRVETAEAAHAATTATADALSTVQQDGLQTAVKRLLEWTTEITIETHTEPAAGVRLSAGGRADGIHSIDTDKLSDLTPTATQKSAIVGTGPPTVTATYRADRQPATARRQRIAIATQPTAREEQNGDGAIIVHSGNRVLCGVVDGLGHGPQAAAASDAAVTHIREHATDSLESLFTGIDTACKTTRGVVAALATIEDAAGTGRFGSVGNVEWRTDGLPFSLIPRRGVIGTGAPRPTITGGNWPQTSTLVLYSDGLTGVDTDGITDRTTPAADLVELFGRPEDDATALTILPEQ